MGQRRHHYERAFSAMLRELRVPFVSVNEAKRTLLPGGLHESAIAARSLKNFDFVLYGMGTNLLVDVKGRALSPAAQDRPGRPLTVRRRMPRLESWVSEEDVHSLTAWNALFGPDFEAAFVFFYAGDHPPAGDLFDETFAFEDRWYAPRLVAASDYARRMKPRSARWGTVDLDQAAFSAISGPLLASCGRNGSGSSPPVPGGPWIEPFRRENQESSDLAAVWA